MKPGYLAVLRGSKKSCMCMNLKVEQPRTQAKLIIYQAAVKSATETLRAKITQ
jgi:hypothetical protein